MTDIKTEKREQRRFGLAIAVAIALLGLVRYCVQWLHTGVMPDLPRFFIAGAVVFLALGLIAPRALRPLCQGGKELADRLRHVTIWLFLLVLFLVIMIPMCVLMQVLGKDPLLLRRDPNATTYWQDPPSKT